MAAATKKIRLTYLWADESVMVEDFMKKFSRKLTEWTNEFYGMYGFELDVSPGLTESTLPLAHKFCLAKSGGIVPDFEIAGKLYEELVDRITRLEKQREAIKSEKAVLESELVNLPSNDLVARLAVSERINKLSVSIDKIHDEIMLLYSKHDAKLILHDHKTQLRIQMGWKYLTDRIGDEKRLNIVFCRFARDTLMTLRRRTDATIGQTYSQIKSLVLKDISKRMLLWLWPYPFVIIDIRFDLNTSNINTLAHEIVHAAGHDHPPVQKVINDVEAYFRVKPAKAEGSVLNRIMTSYENYLEYLSLFEERKGAYFDGASNDIMNYDALSTEASEYILSDADKKLLENAVFVAPP